MKLLEGDCVEVMVTLEECSVDAIVTDPPYDLTGHRWDSLGAVDGDSKKPNPHVRGRGGFMGKTWDGTGVAFRVETWYEALRVAKPGAHLLAFGGTRTYHRLVCAIEDAGWEIRDCLVWAYASGFPKSLNLPGGLGTALKPAWEPIVMARKPLRGTVAANVASYGTGALNIDGTRIPFVSSSDAAAAAAQGYFAAVQAQGDLLGPAAINPGPIRELGVNELGRWPANVLLTDPIFDGDTPGVVGGGDYSAPQAYVRSVDSEGGVTGYGDSGTYSRFFLIPKADRAEREPVLGGRVDVYEHSGPRGHSLNGDGTPRPSSLPRFNSHPTVKPVELMRHLIRLVTPSGGVVLDPFLGSGTTAMAAEMEGFGWIGIEKEPEYVAIARARLLGTQRGLGLVG